MGYRCRWIAVRDARLADVLGALRMTVAQQHGSSVFETGLYAVELPGWLVVIGDGSDAMRQIRAEDAMRLSADTETLAFYCDDTTMDADLVAYAATVDQWSIELRKKLPTVRGDVPPEVRRVVEAAGSDRTAQYEALAEVARERVGFRHDRTLAAGEHLPIYELRVTA